MPRPDPQSLGETLRAAASLQGRSISGADESVSLADLLTGTSLDVIIEALEGRRVLIATRDQFMTAVALAEIDGVASRIVLSTPDLKSEHLPILLADADIDTIVTDIDAVAALASSRHLAVRCHWPLTPHASATQKQCVTEWLLLTSGTSGAPKMVRHDFAGLTAAIKPRAAAAGRPSVWATFYDMRRYGGLQIYLRGLLGDGSLVLSSANETMADHLHRLGRSGVTHISGTPSHWRRALMSAALDSIAPDYIRLSGEIADQTILDSLRQAFPKASVGHAYASTEAGVGFEVDDGLEGFPAAFVGRQGTDVDMAVVDGSLRIRSRRAATRYVGGANADLADKAGFVDTGDIVEQRNGRYYFVGRRGGVINVGGLKVHPEEIETVINRHGGVRMSLVQGRKNPITGAIVVASVVLKEGEGAQPDRERAMRDEILSACRTALPPHKVPAVIGFVASLDVTPAGKLVRPHG